MSILDTLLNRNSHPRLTEPGPDADQLQTILQAAVRAPDHGRLRPWRYVVISGDRRAALGECFHQSLKLKATIAQLLCRRRKPTSSMEHPREV